MRIRVLETHIGVRTEGRAILPGEYDIHDPALFECGGYLVNEGVAVRLDDAVSPIADVEPDEEFEFVNGDAVEAEPDAEDVNLNDLTNSELRDQLDKRNIDHSAAKNKAALLALFGKAQ